jgi:epoxyqueuosine reductase
MIAELLARDQLRQHALSLGFSLFGVAPAQFAPGHDNLVKWLDRGYAGEMSYIPKRVEAYRHPNSVLDGCKSVVMLAMPYAANPLTTTRKMTTERKNTPERDKPLAGGKIGNYASGDRKSVV